MQKVIPNIQMQATYHLVVHKRASITGIIQSTFIILSPSATQTNFICVNAIAILETFHTAVSRGNRCYGFLGMLHNLTFMLINTTYVLQYWHISSRNLQCWLKCSFKSLRRIWSRHPSLVHCMLSNKHCWRCSCNTHQQIKCQMASVTWHVSLNQQSPEHSEYEWTLWFTKAT